MAKTSHTRQDWLRAVMYYWRGISAPRPPDLNGYEKKQPRPERRGCRRLTNQAELVIRSELQTQGTNHVDRDVLVAGRKTFLFGVALCGF